MSIIQTLGRAVRRPAPAPDAEPAALPQAPGRRPAGRHACPGIGVQALLDLRVGAPVDVPRTDTGAPIYAAETIASLREEATRADERAARLIADADALWLRLHQEHAELLDRAARLRRTSADYRELARHATRPGVAHAPETVTVPADEPATAPDPAEPAPRPFVVHDASPYDAAPPAPRRPVPAGHTRWTNRAPITPATADGAEAEGTVAA